MVSERWQRIDELFHAALERLPTERSSFLRETCDDNDLRQHVELRIFRRNKCSGKASTAARIFSAWESFSMK